MATSTKEVQIIGYRNVHAYPVSIRMVQGSVTLEPNKWLVDSSGKRVVDPAIRRYCHPDGLSLVQGRNVPKDAPKEASNQTFSGKVEGVVYGCKHCDKTFSDRKECARHEESH